MQSKGRHSDRGPFTGHEAVSQTMLDLLSCSLCPKICSQRDLCTATDNVKAEEEE